MIELLISIVIGGLIIPIVLRNKTQFDNTKEECLKIVRNIQYMENDKGGLDITKFDDMDKLEELSSKLIRMGHHKCGDTVMDLYDRYIKIKNQKCPNYDISNQMHAIDNFQRIVRNLKPNWIALVNF